MYLFKTVVYIQNQTSSIVAKGFVQVTSHSSVSKIHLSRCRKSLEEFWLQENVANNGLFIELRIYKRVRYCFRFSRINSQKIYCHDTSRAEIMHIKLYYSTQLRVVWSKMQFSLLLGILQPITHCNFNKKACNIKLAMSTYCRKI